MKLIQHKTHISKTFGSFANARGLKFLEIEAKKGGWGKSVFLTENE